jgi:hypothetical protein
MTLQYTTKSGQYWGEVWKKANNTAVVKEENFIRNKWSKRMFVLPSVKMAIEYVDNRRFTSYTNYLVK